MTKRYTTTRIEKMYVIKTFWDVTRYRSANSYRHFRGKYCLDLQELIKIWHFFSSRLISCMHSLRVPYVLHAIPISDSLM
jgi:hypothetical protein